MKKLTAGIFVGILTVVTVNAARADIATTTYVQGGVEAAKDYADTKVGDLTTLNTSAKGNTVAAINEVNTAAKTIAGNIVTNGDDVEANKDSTTKYPSMAAMNTSISLAVDGLNADLGDLALKDTVATDDIDDKAVTKAKLADAVQTSLTKADNALPAATYNSQVGTVSATNMGTTATTVVAAIKEVAGEAAAANTAAGTAETNAKAYADGLAKNYATAAQGTKADNALPKADATVTDGTYIKAANTLKANLAALDTGTKAAKDAADDAAITANNALPTATYNSQVGTVSAANMGTTASTVVTAINEVAGEAAAAQADATKANNDVTTINNSAVMTSGATKAKIDQIATNTTSISTNATNITNITKDGGTIDTKIEAAKAALNTSLDGKIDESTALAGKTLTTDATTGQLKDAAAVAGAKPTDCNATGSGCSYMLMSTGTGFAWTKIVDTYK